MRPKTELIKSILSLRFSPLDLLVSFQLGQGEKAYGRELYRKIIEKRLSRKSIRERSFEERVLENRQKRPHLSKDEFIKLYAPGFKKKVEEVLNSIETGEIIRRK